MDFYHIQIKRLIFYFKNHIKLNLWNKVNLKECKKEYKADTRIKNYRLISLLSVI